MLALIPLLPFAGFVVNAFLGKPYQEGELLQELEKVLA